MNRLRSAQRVYMRSSIEAQSWLSVPPAPGMDFEIGVILVGFAGKQRFDLALAHFFAQLSRMRLFGVVDNRLVALLLAHLDEVDIVLQCGARGVRRQLIESSSSWRSRIRSCASCALFQSDGSSARSFR